MYHSSGAVGLVSSVMKGSAELLFVLSVLTLEGIRRFTSLSRPEEEENEKKKSHKEEEGDDDDDDSLEVYLEEEVGYKIRDDYSLMIGDGRFKMVLVVNMKLGMGKGKIAAQCGHATLGAYEISKRYCRSALKCWQQVGTAKIAVKGTDDSALLEVQRNAIAEGLVTYIVHDAGHTQIPAGSMTVLAIGPAPYEVCDRVTGKLKLL